MIRMENDFNIEKGRKSIKINAVFSLIQAMSTVVFPLITFPYISRIFGVDQLGQYNYAKNFVEIFATFAMLGIPTYAQREGAKIRNDQTKVSQLMSELFSFSMIANGIALIALFAVTLSVNAFHSYAYLILIFSITIPMTTIGMSWLFVIYEDYSFITLLGIVSNTFSIMAMFIFVRNQTDIYNYAIITVLASCGSNIIRFAYGRKYCNTKLTAKIDFKRHLKPILLMFSAYISVMIYNKTDTALLGIFGTDYNVGIYSVSTKIYNLVKTCLFALSNVLQTRAVILATKCDKKQSDEFLSKSFNMMMIFVVPCMVGMVFMHEDIILFISGRDYLDAGTSLIILSLSLFFAFFSTMHSSTILIPYGREKVTLNGAIIGAAVNLILNFIFIPLWSENGAALTTLLAEIVVFWIYLSVTRQYYTHLNGVKTMMQCAAGSAGIIAVLFALRNMDANIVIVITVKIAVSAIIYFAMLIAFKNQIMIELLTSVIGKIRQKRGAVNKDDRGTSEKNKRV